MKNNFWKIEKRENAYAAIVISSNGETIEKTNSLTPTGAYTTFRTFNRNSVLKLTKHFNRLEETSKLAGFEIRIDRAALKKLIAEKLSEFTDKEARVRITVDLSQKIGDLYLAMEELITPEEKDYQNGIDTITEFMHRDNPKAKLNSFIQRAETVKKQVNQEYGEVIMVSDAGCLLEGLSSNFFGVKDKKIYTAEDGVLSGTTRAFVLEIAKSANIPVIFEPVRLSAISTLNEAFITSTSRSILPIRKINDFVLPESAPGPITRILMQSFQKNLESNLETLE